MFIVLRKINEACFDAIFYQDIRAHYTAPGLNVMQYSNDKAKLNSIASLKSFSNAVISVVDTFTYETYLSLRPEFHLQT